MGHALWKVIALAGNIVLFAENDESGICSEPVNVVTNHSQCEVFSNRLQDVACSKLHIPRQAASSGGIDRHVKKIQWVETDNDNDPNVCDDGSTTRVRIG